MSRIALSRHAERDLRHIGRGETLARLRETLEGLAVGDRVRFTAEKVDGNFTVTSIDKAP
jgi:hypothetical protein